MDVSFQVGVRHQPDCNGTDSIPMRVNMSTDFTYVWLLLISSHPILICIEFCCNIQARCSLCFFHLFWSMVSVHYSISPFLSYPCFFPFSIHFRWLLFLFLFPFPVLPFFFPSHPLHLCFWFFSFRFLFLPIHASLFFGFLSGNVLRISAIFDCLLHAMLYKIVHWIFRC